MNSCRNNVEHKPSPLYEHINEINVSLINLNARQNISSGKTGTPEKGALKYGA